MLSDLKATDILEIIQFFHFDDNPIVRQKAFICKDYNQVIIGVNMVILKCHGCGREAETDNPPKEFVCKVCGAVNIVPENDGTASEACGCIPPTGFEWKLPAGINRNANGEVEVVTAQGTKMTVAEWISAFGCDPVIAHQHMLELGKTGIPGFFNLSTLGKKK